MNMLPFSRLLPLFLLTTGSLFAEPATQALPEILRRLVDKNHGHGGGVARISGGSGVIWEGAAGLTAGPGSAPMTADTPFEVASITKAVTAATILRLVEDGRLSLDSRLGQVLPANEARGFDGRITIRQLLSHTSGLPDYWTDGPKDRGGNNVFIQSFNSAPNHTWVPPEILTYARQIPAKRPGSSFHYSDTNYILLGRVIEHLTGQPLQTAFRRIIFEPMEMHSTWLTYHEGRRGTAPSHRYEGDEDLNDKPRQSADWAGGGLVSTTRDLEKFLRGLASGRLFRHATTLDTMREAVPVGEPDLSYGLGLYRVKLDGGKGELWGHDGHGNSFAYYWPERDISFTGTLNQTENDWWPLVEAYIEGEDAATALEQNDKSLEISLSTGWDSLYMDRGANCLGDGKTYGHGIYWTQLSATWSITSQDFLTATVWQAFATSGPSYRETDTSLIYTRDIHDFEFSFEYDFNYGYADGNYFSHELLFIASRTFSLGPVQLTPAVTYYFNLGPDADDGMGLAKAGSSFLMFRLDGRVPIYRDVLALAPWTAFGVNFGYNTKDIGDEETAPFYGANNLEFGLALPYKVSKAIQLSAYAAYSHAFTNIIGTEAETFWGGVNVTFTY